MIPKLLHLRISNLVFETKIYIPDKSFLENFDIAIENFKACVYLHIDVDGFQVHFKVIQGIISSLMVAFKNLFNGNILK